jgi:hypothetical protein
LAGRFAADFELVASRILTRSVAEPDRWTREE